MKSRGVSYIMLLISTELAVSKFVKKERFNLLVVGFMGHSAIYDRIMRSTWQSLISRAILY